MNWLASILAMFGTNAPVSPTVLPHQGAIYGIVNFGWYTMSDSELDRYLKALKDNGWLGTIVELRGPFAQFGGTNPTFDFMLKKLERLLNTAKKYELWVWVIDENFNSPYVRMPYSQMEAEAIKVISLVGGYRRVLVQGVSEVASTKIDGGGHADKGVRLLDFYAKNLSGRTDLVYYMYKAGAPVPAWANVCDWHISSIGAGGTVAGHINSLNTDHSTILAAMLGGNKEGQKWDLPDVSTLWSRARNEHKLMVLYHFWGKSPDYACIKHGKVMWGKNGSWR